jgi:hypothetical protein
MVKLLVLTMCVFFFSLQFILIVLYDFTSCAKSCKFMLLFFVRVFDIYVLHGMKQPYMVLHFHLQCTCPKLYTYTCKWKLYIYNYPIDI